MANDSTTTSTNKLIIHRSNGAEKDPQSWKHHQCTEQV